MMEGDGTNKIFFFPLNIKKNLTFNNWSSVRSKAPKHEGPILKD